MRALRRLGLGLGLGLALASGCGRLGFDARGGGGTGDGATVDATMIGDGVVVTTNLVFVTSSTQAPGSLGGLAGADAICNARAGEAGLPGHYVAWLSTSTTNAIDRLASVRGWVRTDGRPFADRPTDLIGGAIYYPIAFDEHGNQPPPVGVETNTGATGQALGADCAGFTSTSGASTYGGPYCSTQMWTQFGTSATGCSDAAALYCFGVSSTTPVAAPTPAAGARRAFLLGSGWSPGSGLASADAACQSAANTAALGGTFLALLSTSIGGAISRFSTTGPPWARLDGVMLADTASDFANERTIATLNVSTSRAYFDANELVWTGAVQLTNLAGTSEACMDWNAMTASRTGNFGHAAQTGQPGFFGGNPLVCNTTTLGLYCLEP